MIEPLLTSSSNIIQYIMFEFSNTFSIFFPMFELSTLVFFLSYRSTIPHLQVKNESHGRKTDESHFHVLVVSEDQMLTSIGHTNSRDFEIMFEIERQNT